MRLSILLAALAAAPAGAIPNYAVLYKANTGTLPACVACHQQDDWELNDFGEDFEHEGRDLKALEKVAKKDSDGDKASNAEEFKAKSNPGDPRSRPEKAGKWLDEAGLRPPAKLLKQAFPDADGFDVTELSLADADAKRLEKTLGAALPDESRHAPVFEANKDDQRLGAGVYVGVDLPGADEPTFAFVAAKDGKLAFLKNIEYNGDPGLKKEAAWSALIGKTAAEILKGKGETGPAAEVKAFRAAVARGLLVLEAAKP